MRAEGPRPRCEERVACRAGREGERQRPHEPTPFGRGPAPERVDLRPFETQGEPSTESNRTRDREQEREDAREQRRHGGGRAIAVSGFERA